MTKINIDGEHIMDIEIDPSKTLSENREMLLEHDEIKLILKDKSVNHIAYSLPQVIHIFTKVEKKKYESPAENKEVTAEV